MNRKLSVISIVTAAFFLTNCSLFIKNSAKRTTQPKTPVTSAPALAGVISLINSDLKTIDENVTAVTLSFSKASDSIAPQSKLAYRAYFSTQNNISSVDEVLKNGTAASSETNDVTQLRLGGLNPDTVYYATVLVTNEVGDKKIYLPLKFKTKSISAALLSSGYVDSGNCYLKPSGKLYCWGNNNVGQLGFNDTLPRGDKTYPISQMNPIDLGSGRLVKSASKGALHTCVITDLDQLRCWGYGPSGTIGNIDSAHRGNSSTTPVSGLTDLDFGTGRTVRKVSAGYVSSCAILDTGGVRCWGRNTNGALGIDSTTDPVNTNTAMLLKDIPDVNLGSGRTAKDIVTTAANFSCAILDNDTVKCWGLNSLGQLGYGDAFQRGHASGTYAMANVPAVPLNLPTGRKPVSIHASTHYACVVVDDGNIKCWGYGGYGSLGYDDTTNRGTAANPLSSYGYVNLGTGRTAKSIALGAYHMCAVLDDGNTKCWGSAGANGFGQLGLDDNLPRGNSAGSMATLPAVNIGIGRTAVQAAAGDSHTCVLLDNDKINCWGSNQYGGLGQGNSLSYGSGQPMSSVSSVNFGSGVTLHATAPNRLAVGGVPTGGTNTLAAGFTCSILNDGNVRCFGYNGFGSLGINTNVAQGTNTASVASGTNVILGAGRTAKELSRGVGAGHVCAILDNDVLKCWGQNTYGQLGVNDTSHRGATTVTFNMASVTGIDLGASRTPKSVATGTNHTCAILDNDSVKCWGLNTSGQLGVDDAINRGNTTTTYTMANLPPVDLGFGRTAKQIAAGTISTCAILDTNDVKCWGGNTNGVLGYDDTNLRGNATGTYQMNTIPTVNLGSGRTAKQLAIAQYHTCAILDTNEVKCWGWGGSSRGMLGTDDGLTRGASATSGMNTTIPVFLGTGRTAVKISAGGGNQSGLDSPTCAVLDNGDVKCWGMGFYGNLGQDNYTSHGSGGSSTNASMTQLDPIYLGAGRTAQDVAITSGHACALLDTNEVKCWGINNNGQLGMDNITTYGVGRLMSTLVPFMFK